jgi:hypothetical protein
MKATGEMKIGLVTEQTRALINRSFPTCGRRFRPRRDRRAVRIRLRPA